MIARQEDLLYEQIATDLREKMDAHDIGPGEALPPERELARQYEASVNTIRRGIRQLVKEGRLEKRHGVGNFVLEQNCPPLPTVAILVPQLRLSYYAQMVELAEQYCLGKLTVISNPSELPVSRRISMTAGRHRLFDAILVTWEINRLEYEKCRKLFPRSQFIFIDAQVPDTDMVSYSTDNIKGGQLATRHLLQQGCRNIVFLGCGSINGRERALGCRLELECWKLPMIHIESNVHFNDGYNAMRAKLSSGTRPDGVFAVTDMAAMGAVTALKEFGLRVPDDVRVVGYSNTLEGSSFVPALTTVDADLDGMMRHVFQDLDWRLKHPETGISQIYFHPRLIVRASSESGSLIHTNQKA